MRGPGEILVVSCYELGRQPVAAADALARLEQAGFLPAALDISVDKLDPALLRRARLVAVSVPMHTALQLGVRVAAQARAAGVSRVAFFGLYATLNAEHLLAKHADFALGAEESLVQLAQALERGTPYEALALGRGGPLPSRGALPQLSRYAQLELPGGASRLVAAVEASRGCKHLCAHCPIVPVYRGRFVAVERSVVLADIEQQIARGAQHVSFGDPDFLNGPTHALKLARELHERWPALSFDATIKIEHILQHAELFPELVRCGLLFVTSAVESLSDEVLLALRKGHTAQDVPRALRVLRDAGAVMRPTLLPYTPWTKLRDLPALFDFAVEHDLIDAIDPVQYTLRLLLPRGSAVLDFEASPVWLRSFDDQAFSWRWEHPDPRVDALWHDSSQLMHARAGADPLEVFGELRALAGSTGPAPRPVRRTPRLTEPWFC